MQSIHHSIRSSLSSSHVIVNKVLIDMEATVATSQAISQLGEALIEAVASSSSIEHIRSLLESKAPVRYRQSSSGKSALHCSMRHPSPFEVAKLLLDHKASAKCLDMRRSTSLHAAVAANVCDAIELLLNRGAMVDAIDQRGRSALFYARSQRAVELLIDRHADIALTDARGYTPLHHIASMRYEEQRDRDAFADIARILIEQCADPHALVRPELTPLHLCVDSTIARTLLELKAEPNRSTATRMTPLHTCSEPEVVRVLVEARADINANAKLNHTPLHRAAIDNRHAVIEPLLAARADINAVDSFSRTPLFLAVKYGSLEAARLLILCGCDKTVPGVCLIECYTAIQPLTRPRFSIHTYHGGDWRIHTRVPQTPHCAILCLPSVRASLDTQQATFYSYSTSTVNSRLLVEPCWSPARHQAMVPSIRVVVECVTMIRSLAFEALALPWLPNELLFYIFEFLRA